jgi:hypothetical protein
MVELLGRNSPKNSHRNDLGIAVLLLAGKYDVGLRGTPPSMPVSSSLPS